MGGAGEDLLERMLRSKPAFRDLHGRLFMLKLARRCAGGSKQRVSNVEAGKGGALTLSGI
jgi:hypothetical protein